MTNNTTKNKKYPSYPFLPRDVMNFKLNANEIEVFKIRHMYCKMNNIEHMSKDDRKDFCSILVNRGGSDFLLVNDSIENNEALWMIGEDLLFDIINKYNIKDEFYIQDAKMDIMHSILYNMAYTNSHYEGQLCCDWDFKMRGYFKKIRWLIKNVYEKDCRIVKFKDGLYLYTGDLDKEIHFADTLYQSGKKNLMKALDFIKHCNNIVGDKQLAFSRTGSYHWPLDDKSDGRSVSAYVSIVDNPEDFIPMFDEDGYWINEFGNKENFHFWSEYINSGAYLTYKGIELLEFFNSFNSFNENDEEKISFDSDSFGWSLLKRSDYQVGQAISIYGTLSRIDGCFKIFTNLRTDDDIYLAGNLILYNNLSECEYVCRLSQYNTVYHPDIEAYTDICPGEDRLPYWSAVKYACLDEEADKIGYVYEIDGYIVECLRTLNDYTYRCIMIKPYNISKWTVLSKELNPYHYY